MAELGSGNGSGYPGSIDSDAALEVNASAAGKTKARAEVVNDLAAAIIALQTELGTDPAGSLTNVKSFLQTEHELTGAHKATHVVTMSGTQIVTGSKTLTNVTLSGNVTISGNVAGAMIWTTSPQRIRVSPDTISMVLTRGSAEDFQIRTNDNGFGAQEDATKKSWAYAFNVDDEFGIYRRPAAGAYSKIFSVSDSGRVGTGIVPLARVEGYTGSKVIDVGSLAAGAVTADSITVTGAALGDFVLVSSSIDTGGVLVIGSVEATDQVQLIFYNATALTVDLASATYYAKVIKKDF